MNALPAVPAAGALSTFISYGGPDEVFSRRLDGALRRHGIAREGDEVELQGDQQVGADDQHEERSEGGRRHFRYEMDAPILNFWSILSARYTVARDEWRPKDGGEPVAIEIYHHDVHAYNVDKMIAAIKASLDCFTVEFSPYQHRQVRILEFPQYASFAQSFPNTIPYSESIGFIADASAEEDIDYVFYVTAHEVAHQWWAHQVIGADVQGSTMMSESLAQYSALMIMERAYGRDKMKKFLAYELRSYLRGRSGETKKELPISLAEDQPYIHYNKGSLVFYALREYLGEDVRLFLAEFWLTTTDIATWVCHPGGPKVIEAVESVLDLPDDALDRTRKSLWENGNLSSVSVLDVLSANLAAPPAEGELGMMIAMGPGFCSELVLLGW